MIFPRFVFRDGGKIQRAGGSYSELLVEDESGYDAAIADGWFSSLSEAIEGRAEVLSKEESDTRSELEEMAKELGIQFDGRTSNKKLLEKIKEASEE